MTHKCFISFKTEDLAFKEAIQNMGIDMIDKSLNEAIDSDNEDYIMQRIRQDYLSDSTVTIHLIGSNNSEYLGEHEQRFIKRELQGSLYNGENNSRNGILGVVLPHMYDEIYRGSIACGQCGAQVTHVDIGDRTTVKEFHQNYYIPGKCHYTDEDRYCILTTWDEFKNNPNQYIEAAFLKRSHPVSKKVRVRPQ